MTTVMETRRIRSEASTDALAEQSGFSEAFAFKKNPR